MKKMTNIQDLFDFVSKKNDFKSVESFYRRNNIKKEIVDFGLSFIKSLLMKVDETYLGPEYIENENQMMKHFMWCFKQVSNDVKKNEGINIKLNSLLFDYMLDYNMVFLYKKIDSIESIKERLDYFEGILSMNYDKSQMDLELLKQFYDMFFQNMYKE